MRGEEPPFCFPRSLAVELPPHARRRAGTGYGNRNSRWNYLRMRGEEPILVNLVRYSVELPPHARRRDPRYFRRARNHGITSACAEKSFHATDYSLFFRNYLRMRGEESCWISSRESWAELPPHARRRAGVPTENGWPMGITSACAEKSRDVAIRVGHSGNYLRMRGEESRPMTALRPPSELPPHARRRGFCCVKSE